MKYVAVLKPDNNIIIRGDSCCTSLKDLYTALVDKNTTEIEISKEFANEFFTYTALCDFVEYSAALVPNVRVVVDDTVYDNLLHAAMELKTYTDSGRLIYALECNPTLVLSTIQELCKYYMEAHAENTAANNKIATMAVQIEELTKSLAYSKDDYAKLMATKNDLEAKLHALVSRVNFRYEKTVSPDDLFIAKNSNYNHILYIKEITRVHYTDTLVYYLQEILKTLYDTPVRVVAIEPYYSWGRNELYPGFKPHWDLSYRDVYAGNIYMAGYQPKLMRDILQNANHVNYLIVIDRGGYAYPHIDVPNMTVIHTASDVKDIPKELSRKHVISYSDNTLYIPHIDDFDSLSPESKIQKYSSMSITKELIEYLEGVN